MYINPSRGYWISELTFLERFEHTHLSCWDCLAKETRIHVLRDKILFMEKCEKHCRNRHLNELNKAEKESPQI